MIAPPLVAPADGGSSSYVPGLRWRVAGGITMTGAILALVVWLFALSPFGFHRWSYADEIGTVSIEAPGTYVVFVEYEGASSPGQPRLSAAVRSVTGRRIETTPLVDDRGESLDTYHLPGYEGRVIASFAIDKPGTYQVTTYDSSSGSSPSGTMNVPMDAKVAVGRDYAVRFPGSLAALVPLVLVPYAIGTWLLLIGRRRFAAARGLAGSAGRSTVSAEFPVG